MLAKTTKELGLTRDSLIETLQQIPDALFNTVPFETSWTPGQVAEHILKFVNGSYQLLHAPASESDRDPAAKIETIRSIFLDFSSKYKSPASVEPGSDQVNKTQIIQSLREVFDQISQTIGRVPMDLTCTVFELPGVGLLTRWEWVWFAIYHSQRHIRQLQNINTTFNQAAGAPSSSNY